MFGIDALLLNVLVRRFVRKGIPLEYRPLVSTIYEDLTAVYNDVIVRCAQKSFVHTSYILHNYIY